MFDTIRRLIDLGDERTVSECRRCGTTIGSRGDACPYCGPTETVDYEIE